MSDASDAGATVLVVGAGTMGAGIAQVAAGAAFDTVLYDAVAGAVERAKERVSRDLDRGVSLGKLTPAAARETLDRIRPADDLGEAAVRASLIVEAVVEDIYVKRQVIRTVSEASGAAVIATNTSALSVTELAAAAVSPERVIGMHFFNPVPRMKLVEVIRGLETADPTVARTIKFATSMGKEAVEVNEYPGFAVSRINVLLGNEAFYTLQEGVASARDIDKAIRLGLNHPMGPLEMGDMVGLDVRLRVLEYLHRTLGEKYRPAPLLVKYVQAGRLGRKVGRGVYDYASAEVAAGPARGAPHPERS